MLIVFFKLCDEWFKGWNQDDIVEVMCKVLQVLFGVQIVMVQLIFDCVDEMVIGVCFDVVIKVFGDDLNMLCEKVEVIVKVVQGIQGVQDMCVEWIIGQQYLQIVID